MIKICHITTVHSPFDVRIFHKECKTLAKAGYEVYLIAQHDKEEIIDKVHIIPLPKVRNRLERMLFLTIEAFKGALKLKADIYHFHDPELIPIGVLLKIFSKKKVIYDVHEDVPKQIMSKYWIPKKLRGVISFLVNLVEKVFSIAFDVIITATDDILKNFSFHRNAISIKNYPILLNFLDIRREEKGDKVFNLIYVGGLAKIRGISEIVRALEYVDSDKNFRLILCGSFSSIEYEKEVRSLKGFGKTEYLGFVKHEKIPVILKSVDAGIVCLHPIINYISSLPIKLFEYMAAGLPVIASNFPLWKEIVEGNNCGICVDPLNPKEIADAIKYLIERPEERKRMGENGRRAVLERYNWEKESEKLLRLYKELLKEERH